MPRSIELIELRGGKKSVRAFISLVLLITVVDSVIIALLPILATLKRYRITIKFYIRVETFFFRTKTTLDSSLNG